MTAFDTVTWIALALLGPFSWALGLLLVALLGDLSKAWRRRVARVFDLLEAIHRMPAPGTGGVPTTRAA